MSTHYIEEAELLCDEVAIMSHGQVVTRGTPQALLAEYAGAKAVEYYGPPALLAEVEAVVHAAGLTTRRTGPSVSVLRAESMADSLAASLGEGTWRASNLEDVFVVLTGESVE